MQITKYLVEAKTPLGTDVIFDFMQIDSYEPVTQDENGTPFTVSVMKVTMSGGDIHYIVANCLQMKNAAGMVGVPIISL
jgi:hypothetical protein